MTWADLLKAQALPYDVSNQELDFTPLESSAVITAVQFETSFSKKSSLGLVYRNPLEIADLHGETAANILATQARSGGAPVDIFFIGSNQALSDDFFQLRTMQTRSLFDHANYVCLSMVWTGKDENISMGTLNTFGAIRDATDFWSHHDNIVLVQSVGNDGDIMRRRLQRPVAEHILFAPYMAVGEASLDALHAPQVCDHSSPSADVIVVNPFNEGFAARYLLENEALAARIDGSWSPQYNGPHTAQQVFEDKVKDYIEKLREWSLNIKDERPQNPFSAGCRYIFWQDFEGRALLQSDNPNDLIDLEKVRAAYRNGLLTAMKHYKSYFETDDQGYMTDLAGTSFAAPQGCGFMSNANALYPRFCAPHILSAAFMAAQPIMAREGAARPLVYKPNGGGKMVNNIAGFGLLDADALRGTVAELDAFCTQNPNLSLAQAWISTGAVIDFCKHTDGPGIPAGMDEYRITLKEDALVRRFELALIFTGGPNHAPDYINVASPSGVSVEVSPTRLGAGVVSIAASNSLFGNHAKGEWAIQVDENEPVDVICLWVQGEAPGGALDEFWKQKRAGAPSGP